MVKAFAVPRGRERQAPEPEQSAGSTFLQGED
jgi:hypothetical protein